MDNKYKVKKYEIAIMKESLEEMYNELENDEVGKLGAIKGYILGMTKIIDRIIKENEIKY